MKSGEKAGLSGNVGAAVALRKIDEVTVTETHTRVWKGSNPLCVGRFGGLGVDEDEAVVAVMMSCGRRCSLKRACVASGGRENVGSPRHY
jgi:hypothetical protein